MTIETTLVYVHDPMCSWCYGFGPVLAELLGRLPSGVGVRRLLGGLAPDSDAPMPPQMRAAIQQTWRRIEQTLPGTRFNHDFWTRCTPRRSTYRACRAVLLARDADPALDSAMTQAIQHAYYREARNPSDRETLVDLAAGLGLPIGPFAAALDAPETCARLATEIDRARVLGADSFPSLVLTRDEGHRPIPIDYRDHRPMLAAIAERPEPAS